MIDTKEGRADIQRDLDKLEKRVDRNLMKLNKKCKVLQLGRNSLRHQYRLGDDQLGNSSAEKNLGVLVGTKLNMNHQCALAMKNVNV